MRSCAALLILAAAAPACSTWIIINPGVIDASGTWIVVRSCPSNTAQPVSSCAITLHITQTESDLAGTFTEDGGSGGSLTGAVVNGTMSVTFVDAARSGCAFTMAGPVAGDQWTVTAASGNCTGAPERFSQALGPTPLQFRRAKTG